MASITVPNLNEGLERLLHKRAGENGRSMEQEAVAILRKALVENAAPSNLGTALFELFRPVTGDKLEIPPRDAMREPPRFD